MREKVFCTRNIPDSGINLLKEKYNVEVWDSPLPPSRETLLEKAKDCSALITLLSDTVDENLLASCPKLKIVANYAVGYNNIDLEAAKKLKIKVSNTPDVLSKATAETAFMLTLAVARKILPAYNNAKSGNWKTWEPRGFLGLNLEGKTFGVVGLGRIGFEYAKLVKSFFNAKIIYCANSEKKEAEKELGAQRVDLQTLAQEADVVSLHCSLNSSTKHLISSDFLTLLKKTAILINTSRGEVVDQQALFAALKSGAIFGAGLDVTTPEPLPPSNELYTLDNCLILPHIASATYETRDTMSLLCAENIIAALENKKIITEVL